MLVSDGDGGGAEGKAWEFAAAATTPVVVLLLGKGAFVTVIEELGAAAGARLTGLGSIDTRLPTGLKADLRVCNGEAADERTGFAAPLVEGMAGLILELLKEEDRKEPDPIFSREIYAFH